MSRRHRANYLVTAERVHVHDADTGERDALRGECVALAPEEAERLAESVTLVSRPDVDPELQAALAPREYRDSVDLDEALAELDRAHGVVPVPPAPPDPELAEQRRHQAALADPVSPEHTEHLRQLAREREARRRVEARKAARREAEQAADREAVNAELAAELAAIEREEAS